jgi:hypothetical protein
LVRVSKAIAKGLHEIRFFDHSFCRCHVCAPLFGGDVSLSDEELFLGHSSLSDEEDEEICGGGIRLSTREAVSD